MAKKKKYPVWHPKYWPIHISVMILRLLALLPYWVKFQLGKQIGLILFYSSKKMRKTCEINIKHCFAHLSPKEQKALAKKNFIALGECFMDMVSLAWPKEKEVGAMYHSIKGVEHLENAIKSGKGALILFPHLINIYTIGYLVLNKLNMPFSIMYHSPRNPVLKKFAYDRLSHYCDKVFNRRDIRPMIQHLQAGNLVWYAPDLDPGKRQAVFAPFFSVMAATHTATARILKATGAQAIPIGFYRRPDRKFEIEFYPPIVSFPTGNDLMDAQILNETLEKIIAKHPEQYLWQYQRFATRPPGEKSIY